MTSNPHLLRERNRDAAKVTFVELFFDLVFVFAVTQLSHLLLAHLTLAGVLETTLLLMAVWWVWIYTSWVTNWLDPDRPAVRLMLFALMLAGLVLSSSLPKAFGEKGLVFACAYVAMQVGRSLFMLWALRRDSPQNYRNFQRITVWLIVSGVFWIAGGLTEGQERLLLWSSALVIEYLSPTVGFRVPGLGRSTTAQWDVDGAHLAERCALFIIIALGESVLVTGATFSELPWQGVTVATFVIAFVGSVAMWWIYFNLGAERAHHRITNTQDPGQIARLAFNYLHLPMVAGIIVSAVADELVLAHPTGALELKVSACILAGPALYLFGNMLFKRAISGYWALSHGVSLVLLAALVPAAPYLSPLALYAIAAAILLMVAAWETLSFRRGPQKVAG